MISPVRSWYYGWNPLFSHNTILDSGRTASMADLDLNSCCGLGNIKSQLMISSILESP